MGFSARRLRGLIHAPVNLQAGYLEIDDDRGTFLSAVNLPAVAPDQAAVPFDVDISAAHPSPSSVGLSFTLRQVNGTGQICGPAQQLAVTDLANVFAGAAPAPTTVSTFFPSVLQRVTLYAPVDADKAEQQAVLTLASALTRHYAPQQVAITAVNQPRGAAPPPTGDLTRAIVVERGPADLTVTNPGAPNVYLRLSGRDDQLSAQVSLLANQMQPLAQTVSARVDQPGSRTTQQADTLTFSQLKITGRTDVLRTGALTVGVDRAAFRPRPRGQRAGSPTRRLHAGGQGLRGERGGARQQRRGVRKGP